MTPPALQPNDEWQGILRPSEEILWQGKPDPGFYVHPSRRRTFRGGLLVAAFGILFVIAGVLIGIILMSLFALLVVAFGAALLGHGGVWPTYLRRHSFYTLTTQRAIIGIARPGKEPSLKTFEIIKDSDFEFVPGRLGSIVFDREVSGVEINDEPQIYAVGFMRFEGADEVWQMIQDLRKAGE